MSDSELKLCLLIGFMISMIYIGIILIKYDNDSDKDDRDDYGDF